MKKIDWNKSWDELDAEEEGQIIFGFVFLFLLLFVLSGILCF